MKRVLLLALLVSLAFPTTAFLCGKERWPVNVEFQFPGSFNFSKFILHISGYYIARK